MPSLTHLELRQSLVLSESGLKSLASLECLQSLCLGPCNAAPARTTETVSCNTQLTRLELCFSPHRHVKVPVPPGEHPLGFLPAEEPDT